MIRASSFIQRLQHLVHAENIPEIGRKLGMARNTFYNFQNESRYPSTEVLLRIREKTGASIDWLLTGDGPMLIQPGTGTSQPPPTNPISSTPFDSSSSAPSTGAESSAKIESTHRIEGHDLSIHISISLNSGRAKGDFTWDTPAASLPLSETELSHTTRPIDFPQE